MCIYIEREIDVYRERDVDIDMYIYIYIYMRESNIDI